jgi:hypothetical protein
MLSVFCRACRTPKLEMLFAMTKIEWKKRMKMRMGAKDCLTSIKNDDDVYELLL